MPTTDDSNSSTSRQTPWNKGQLVGQKRPLKPKDVWSIRARLEIEGRERDLALFNLAIDSKLRASDLVSLRIEDVQIGGRVRERATIIQQKTARPVQFELTDGTRKAIQILLLHRGSGAGFLFPSRSRGQSHLSTRQYARLVHGWVTDAGLDSPAYGTHSMRRNKAAQIYRKTGNLRAVQLLLGHRKLESTVRYLGIEVDDALSISEQLDL
ncbi:tyrosine-type recombinase/integrase [Inquilinus sp. CA228]|uniref:tyrosine-type recombinase/integrase n=1 Tax=Inquilinus sp. CA228 TaxID=3455609 RepID=UPI003F8D6384